MEQRRQRRALAARRDIRRAKIADDWNAQLLDQISRFAQLQCGGVLSTRVMEHRLTMQSDKLHTLSPQTASRLDCVETAQIVMHLAHIVGSGLIGGRSVQPFLQLLRESCLPVLQQADPVQSDLARGVIHGINARAGHDAEHGQRFFLDADHSASPFTQVSRRAQYKTRAGSLGYSQQSLRDTGTPSF